MKSKGVTFDLCSEEDARETLYDKTYYFKLSTKIGRASCRERV